MRPFRSDRLIDRPILPNVCPVNSCTTWTGGWFYSLHAKRSIKWFIRTDRPTLPCWLIGPFYLCWLTLIHSKKEHDRTPFCIGNPRRAQRGIFRGFGWVWHGGYVASPPGNEPEPTPRSCASCSGLCQLRKQMATYWQHNANGVTVSLRISHRGIS